MSDAPLPTPDGVTLAVLWTERTRHPEMAPMLNLQIDLLEARASVAIAAPPFTFSPADARVRLERGEPILYPSEFTPDWGAVAHLSETICRIAARHRPEHTSAFTWIENSLSSPSRLESSARAWLGAPSAPPALDAPAAVDPTLAGFVLNNALHPFLMPVARACHPLVQEAGYLRACPVCGGEPDFAALGKEGGGRRLLCSRCDAEWMFHRTVCPFCGDEASQGYFSAGQGEYRLYTCQNCKRYLKTLDVRELAREAHLPAERVLTIGLDLVARDAGYRAGPN